jgi:DNA polymerase-1
MIVITNPTQLFDILKTKKKFSIDSETTGLKWQKGDYAFLWSFADADEEYIVDLREVNFKDFYTGLHELLDSPDAFIIGANPKFDLHMVPGLTTFKPVVSDIQILYRLLNNDTLKVSVDTIATHYGKSKDDKVKEWIQKNKAYRYEKSVYGDLEKIPRYDAVPNEIMYPYAAQDARLHYDLFELLVKDLDNLDEYNRGKKTRTKTIQDEINLEYDMTRVLFEMETRGVMIDEAYTGTALSSERGKAESARKRLEEITGATFTDSAKALEGIFGVDSDIVRSAPRTEKGSLSFADSYLSTLEHPAAKLITEHRTAYKAARTYYANFIDLASQRGDSKFIHTNFRQSSTATGRLSASDPNMQNITAIEDIEYPVRGCFVSPQDYYWVSMDYQAQEMRLMFDRAGQEDVIADIKGGLDVHQATANLMRVSRKAAKAINFGILYGMGAQKLADSIGVSLEEARMLKRKYLMALPKVSEFIDIIVSGAKRGKISGIFGRIYQFQERWAYKAINYLIQGGSASMTKKAMISCNNFLKGTKSSLVLSVHDELVFYIHKDETDLISTLKRLMIEAYPHISLPMDVGVEIGHRWSELQEYSVWHQNQKQSSKIA